MNNKNTLTKGLQDYIEYIFNEINAKKEIKAIDIANHFDISRASVSEALIRLCEAGLIIYEGRKGIIITPRGENEAKKIIKKHNVLSDFFVKILNIDFKSASDNACKIEHVIDEDLVKKIEKFTDFCIENGINKKFSEAINNDK